jgi:hypothetical protein
MKKIVSIITILLALASTSNARTKIKGKDMKSSDKQLRRKAKKAKGAKGKSELLPESW